MSISCGVLYLGEASSICSILDYCCRVVLFAALVYCCTGRLYTGKLVMLLINPSNGRYINTIFSLINYLNICISSSAPMLNMTSMISCTLGHDGRKNDDDPTHYKQCMDEKALLCEQSACTYWGC